MKPFHERNPVRIGAISIMVIALLIVLAFKAEDLPIIGGGTTYYADFTEAGGLQSGDEVRVAGVRVGKVSDVGLDDGHVRVAFKIKHNTGFGTDTGAAIKIQTVLGQMYLDLQPAGPGQLPKGSEIPVARTRPPYDIVQAFSGLSNVAGKINTNKLAHALTTIADLTRTTPTSFREALSGLSRLSNDVAAKDDQINALLKHLNTVSKTLDARDQDIVGLMRDAGSLFNAIVARRQAIHQLLVSTSSLSTQLTSLIDTTKGEIKPALAHLKSVVAVFNRNQDNLDKILTNGAPFYRVFTNLLGNGPWFDMYIQNLPPLPQVTR